MENPNQQNSWVRDDLIAETIKDPMNNPETVKEQEQKQ